MPDEPKDMNDLPEARPDPLAEALARLEPAPARLDRDRLMFAAGAESRRSTIRLWQLTAGFLAAVGFAAGMAAYKSSIVPTDYKTQPADRANKSDPPGTIPTGR